MKNKRIIIIILSIFILICLSGIIYFGIKIFNWKKDVDSNNSIKNNLFKSIIVNDKNGGESKYNIDWKTLKTQNPDSVAYLKVDGTNIDYVVVKSSDNKYYLDRNFSKEYNVAGWIFADYRNSLNGSDKNLVIYGHNTLDGSMFGTLKNTLDKEWYENKDNGNIVLVTENGEYNYHVFSTYTIVPEDYYITTYFNNDDDFYSFIINLKNRSIYDYGVELSKEDKILTLSSCYGNSTKRVVLHAKLINIK